MLSRVESGLGAMNGDSLGALAWSLYVAGSPTTLVNRWLPSHESGSKAVPAFYRAWLARTTAGGARLTPAEAMQKAARTLIAQPGTGPADWAAFMVLGR
jgi:CHAT domain-containing protein